MVINRDIVVLGSNASVAAAIWSVAIVKKTKYNFTISGVGVGIERCRVYSRNAKIKMNKISGSATQILP